MQSFLYSQVDSLNMYNKFTGLGTSALTFWIFKDEREADTGSQRRVLKKLFITNKLFDFFPSLD